MPPGSRSASDTLATVATQRCHLRASVRDTDLADIPVVAKATRGPHGLGKGRPAQMGPPSATGTSTLHPRIPGAGWAFGGDNYASEGR